MATITILTQYHENYNTDTINPPYWKPKGGHKFVIEVDDTSAMYCPDLKALLVDLIAEQNSDIEKFEYIEHDVDFAKPTTIHQDRFDRLARKQFDSEETEQPETAPNHGC